MKKIFAIIAILVVVAGAFVAGRASGVRHALEDSIIWTVERYDPENPEETAREDGTDQTIYIELDGNLYEHGMFQG